MNGVEFMRFAEESIKTIATSKAISELPLLAQYAYYEALAGQVKIQALKSLLKTSKADMMGREKVQQALVEATENAGTDKMLLMLAAAEIQVEQNG